MIVDPGNEGLKEPRHVQLFGWQEVNLFLAKGLSDSRVDDDIKAIDLRVSVLFTVSFELATVNLDLFQSFGGYELLFLELHDDLQRLYVFDELVIDFEVNSGCKVVFV